MLFAIIFGGLVIVYFLYNKIFPVFPKKVGLSQTTPPNDGPPDPPSAKKFIPPAVAVVENPNIRQLVTGWNARAYQEHMRTSPKEELLDRLARRYRLKGRFTRRMRCRGHKAARRALRYAEARGDYVRVAQLHALGIH